MSEYLQDKQIMEHAPRNPARIACFVKGKSWILNDFPREFIYLRR